VAEDRVWELLYNNGLHRSYPRRLVMHFDILSSDKSTRSTTVRHNQKHLLS